MTSTTRGDWIELTYALSRVFLGLMWTTGKSPSKLHHVFSTEFAYLLLYS